MTWVIVGLSCTTLSCMWIAPAFDTGSYFPTEHACNEAIRHISPASIRYFVLECRRGDDKKRTS